MNRGAEQLRFRALRPGRPGQQAPGAQPVSPLADSFPFRVVSQAHRPRDAALRRYLAAADLAALFAVQTAVMLAIPRLVHHPETILWAAAMLPVWLVVFKAYGLYDRDIKRISHTTLDDLPWIFHGVIVGTLIMFLWFRWGPTRAVHGQDLLPMAAATMAAMLGMRAFARRLARRIHGAERVLLIGERKHIDLIARKMRAHPEYRLEPVGVLGDDPGKSNGIPVFGRFTPDRFASVLLEGEIDRVVVSHVDVGEEALLNVVRRCRELSVKVSLLPQLSDAMGPSVEIDDVEGVTVLGITPPVLPRSSRTLKRLMDVVGSLAMLLLLAPLLACAAVAIKVTSPGPVLFRQDRVGRRGRTFKVLKFRTMVADAEDRREELLAESRDPNWLDLEHDPRITRVGQFLRHTSIDELPQLWNVLKGEMSLVGPRPIVPSEAEALDGWRMTRVDLTPGLTGLWQVLGRTNIPFEEMITLDYLYVTNWSLWTDVRLLIRTVPSVIAQRGVN